LITGTPLFVVSSDRVSHSIAHPQFPQGN